MKVKFVGAKSLTTWSGYGYEWNIGDIHDITPDHVAENMLCFMHGDKKIFVGCGDKKDSSPASDKMIRGGKTKGDIAKGYKTGRRKK